MHPEQAAFERSIDENPHEGTTRHAYADWLRDQGQHDEGAFQESMGNWLTGNGGAHWENFTMTPQYHAGGKLGYPKGVTLQHMDFPRQPNHPDLPLVTPPPRHKMPSHYPVSYLKARQREDPSAEYHIGWLTHRGREEAFRRSFMANRPKPLSRSSRTKYRRRSQ